MQLIAQYPVNEAALGSYFGRPVGAVLANGDFVYGIMDRVYDGNLVLRPLNNVPQAALAQIKKSVKTKMKNMKLPKIPYSKEAMSKVRTTAWGGWGGYPYGWGFGNWGWGAGSWWIWPLLFLAALFAFPFFWI